MSGHLRRRLGLAKARLSQVLSSVVLHPQIADDTDSLLDFRYELVKQLHKVEQAVGTVTEIDSEWGQILTNLTGNALNDEEALYQTHISGDAGISVLINSASDMMAELKTRATEIDDRLRLAMNSTGANNTAPMASANAPTAPVGASSNTPMASVPGSAASVQSAAPLHQWNTPINLPRLSLSNYDGDPFTWLSWWDFFSAAVHSQPIPDIIKFQYLTTLLKGEAADALLGFTTANSTYQEAVNILQSRFGDLSVVKDKLYDQLRDLPRVQSGKVTELRHLADKLDQIMRQLRTLGEDLDVSGNRAILSRMIFEKLPRNVVDQMDAERSVNAPWQIGEVCKKLRDIVDRKERVGRLVGNIPVARSSANTNTGIRQGHASGGRKPDSNVAQHHTRTDVFTATATSYGGKKNSSKARSSAATKQHSPNMTQGAFMKKARKPGEPARPCILCDGNHWDDCCTKVVSIQDRKKVFNTKMLCYRCSRTGHSANECKISRECPKCHQHGHARSLCPSSSFTANQSSMVNVEVVVPPSNVSHNVVQAQNVAKVITPVVKRRAACVLTADVMVFNPENPKKRTRAKLTFDDGADVSFCTKELAHRLGLSSQPESIDVCTFASRRPKKLNTELVTMSLLLKDGSSMDIDCHSVAPFVLGGAKRRPVLTQEDLKFLVNNVGHDMLAESVPFEMPTRVPEIHVGIDYHYDIVDGGQLVLPSGLKLISSRLGYMFGGKANAVEGPTESSVFMMSVGDVIEEDTNDILMAAHTHTSGNLERFWDLEHIGITDTVVDEDDTVAQIDRQTDRSVDPT